MSMLFNTNYSEAYNLAKLAVILHKHNGEFTNKTRIGMDGVFIGSFCLGCDDPISVGYRSLAEGLAKKYGFQYTVDKKKDEVSNMRGHKKQMFSITEKISATQNYEGLFKTAKLKAEEEMRKEFFTYQIDSDYCKFRELPIITRLSNDIMEFLITYPRMENVYLKSTSNGDGYEGAVLWILVREEYVSVYCGRTIDYEYTYDFKYSRYGYDTLQHNQFSGVRKALREKIYTLLQKTYPNAVIMTHGDVDKDNGFCIMSVNTCLRSW